MRRGGGGEVRQPIFDCNISHQRQNVSHCTAHKRRHVKANFNIFRDMAFTLSVPPPLLLFVQFERAPIHMFPHIALLARIPCSVSAVDSHATTYPSLQATSNFTWQNKLHKFLFLRFVVFISFAVCADFVVFVMCVLFPMGVYLRVLFVQIGQHLIFISWNSQAAVEI